MNCLFFAQGKGETYQEKVHCRGSNSFPQLQTRTFCCLFALRKLSREWPNYLHLEECGKWHITVLLVQGYPREKMNGNTFAIALSMFCASANQWFEGL